MEQKTNYVEEIVEKLLKEKEIIFDDEENFLDIEDKMKILILKFICYNKGKLSIVNLFINKYEEVLIDLAIFFFKKLGKLKLKEIAILYEPENYSKIKESKRFHIYLNLTKKELLPFFMMIGFYSYLTLRKNNIEKIKELQLNSYFQEMNNFYLNLKNFALPQILNQYSKIILSPQELSNEGEGEVLDDICLTREELAYNLENYISLMKCMEKDVYSF